MTRNTELFIIIAKHSGKTEKDIENIFERARQIGTEVDKEILELGIKAGILNEINPITEEDVILRRPCVFDPENLISISHKAHNYVHFGIKMENTLIERSPHDTCPWRR